MAEEVIEGKENESLQDKVLKLQSMFDEPIVITLSVSELKEIKLEMAMPTRRWNSSDDEPEGGDENGPSEIKRDFPTLQHEINYFG